jgi:simple sugar transport system substrate-binding protein
MRRPPFVLTLLAVLGCSSQPGRVADDARGELRIVMVTHGQSADPFWSVVANGAHRAARDLGVRVEYQAPTRFDMVEMSQMIDAVVASRPAGLVVSIPDAPALTASIQRAVQAGIPVVSINSGGAAARELGALVHIGQSEYDAGFAAGQRLADAGVRHPLCVNHEVGNSALDQRCTGFGDALARAGGRHRVLAVELADPDDAQQRITSALRADSTLDGLLTLATTGAEPALAALERVANRRVRFATFDLSPRVLEAVQAGQAEFAVDQQQYLQGYLPIMLLTNYLETLTLPGGGHIIATGPGFVTRDVVGRVIELSARGIR